MFSTRRINLPVTGSQVRHRRMKLETVIVHEILSGKLKSLWNFIISNGYINVNYRWAIFHSYVKLPDGSLLFLNLSLSNCTQYSKFKPNHGQLAHQAGFWGTEIASENCSWAPLYKVTTWLHGSFEHLLHHQISSPKACLAAIISPHLINW